MRPTIRVYDYRVAGTYTFTGATWTTDSSQQSGISSWQSATGSGNPPGVSGSNWLWHKTEASMSSGNPDGLYYGTAAETKRCTMTFLFVPQDDEEPGSSLVLKTQVAYFNCATAFTGELWEENEYRLSDVWANCLGPSLTPAGAHAVSDEPDEAPHSHLPTGSDESFFSGSPNPTSSAGSDVVLDVSWSLQGNGTYIGTTSLASWRTHTLTIDKEGGPESQGNAKSAVWYWFRPHTIGGVTVN